MKKSAVLIYTLLTWQAFGGPGSSGIWQRPEAETVFSTDFELTDAAKLPTGYELRQDNKNRKQVIFGEITKGNQALKYEIPFKNLGNRKITLSFYAKSPDGVRCAVWLTQKGQKRKNMFGLDNLPANWKRFEAACTIPTDEPGVIELVAPSSYGSKPGGACLDDITVVAEAAGGEWLGHPEDFPALCNAGTKGLWLCVTARPENKPQLRLYNVFNDNRTLAYTFAPEGITGIGTPDIAPWSKGCVITVPVERKGIWEVACIFFNDGLGRPDAVNYLTSGGIVNIDAAVDAHNDSAMVTWQGNREYPRSIYAIEVIPNRSSEIHTLSSKNMPSSNPDIVYLDDETAFAAWDSFDGDSVNLYGAYYRNGKWEKAIRLTSDPRIERHVHLAELGGEVWLAWQAQTFQKHLINKFSEQRIVVAKHTNEGLQMIPGLFDKIRGTTADSLYMRPRLIFGVDGRMVLTARHSLGAQMGWSALAWIIDEGGISAPQKLWPEQGRWRPADVALHGDSVVAACQRDNLPGNWGIDVGQAPDWKSDVVLLPVCGAQTKETKSVATAPLAMPPTEPALKTHMEKFSARFPRQEQSHAGSKFTLYWGDMHEHSDLSVCQRSQNPPVDDLWANQRDIEMLDFTAITDHGYNMDHPQWAYSSERVRAHFDNHSFVSLLAEEWTSDHVHYEPKRAVKRYGHHNLVYLDTFFPKYYDSRDEPAPTPADVWNDIGDAEFISIPHQLADTGNNPTDWTHHDEHHQPLAEIFQQRESYEYYGAPRQAPAATPFRGHYLQDAWALGLVIGVIASPDHGGGKGKAGVWAEELTREALFKAFHARHTFGTSGAKMSLFVGSNKQMMGDKAILPDGDIPFEIKAVADRPITKVVILRNNKEVHVFEPNSEKVELKWADKDAPRDKTLWYYVRIHRDDEELAWSSPIWFFKSRADLHATVEHARNLPHLHPEGPPSDDPGPGVNLRQLMKSKPGKH